MLIISSSSACEKSILRLIFEKFHIGLQMFISMNALICNGVSGGGCLTLIPLDMNEI